MRKGTLIYSVVLLLILGSAIALMPAGAETVVGTTIFDPTKMDLALPAPSVVKGIIRFPSDSPYTVKDINASTILLENSLPPDTTYAIHGGLVAEFDGEMFVNILWARIYHIGMLEPPYKIWLTVTGNLVDTSGGISFSATGDIKILVHHSPPPP